MERELEGREMLLQVWFHAPNQSHKTAYGMYDKMAPG